MKADLIASQPTITTATTRVTRVATFAEIRESFITGAKSLYTRTAFMPGDVVSGFSMGQPSSESLDDLAATEDIELNRLSPAFLQFINPSSTPNVFFDLGNQVVVCLREIQPGEALTFECYCFKH